MGERGGKTNKNNFYIYAAIQLDGIKYFLSPTALIPILMNYVNCRTSLDREIRIYLKKKNVICALSVRP